MMKNFTIVIPMYNVSNYIVRCLDSVFTQKLPGNISFDIIVVNDGSTDNSEEVARARCVLHSNVKIINQKNKGLGGARNTGIEYASGEYLIFLDSDDILLNDFFITLQDKIIDEDIVEFGYCRISENTITKFQISDTSTCDGIEYILNHNSINSACNKIYRKDFLLEHNLFFVEKIYGEDIEFNVRAFLYARKVKSVKDIIFGFYLSPYSITRNRSDSKKAKYLDDLTSTIISTSKLQCGGDEIIRNYVFYRLTKINVDTLLFILKNKLSKKHAKANLYLLEAEGSLVLSSPMKKREIYRRLLKMKWFRETLINVLLK